MQIVKFNEFKITKLMFKGYKQDRFGVVDGINYMQLQFVNL